jgi:hypothetical protein
MLTIACAMSAFISYHSGPALAEQPSRQSRWSQSFGTDSEMGPLCELAAALMLQAGSLAGYQSFATIEHIRQAGLSSTPSHDRERNCEMSTSVNGKRSHVAIILLPKGEFVRRFLAANDLTDEAAAANLVAYYSSSLKSVFLPESFSPDNVDNRSDLLHELVHHAQDVVDPDMGRFERERRAYEAQIAYLKRAGKPQEANFLKIIMLMQGTDPNEYDYDGRSSTADGRAHSLKKTGRPVR